MFESIAIINNKEIYRMTGSRACYHVALTADRSKFVTFRTLKAAKAFAKEV